MLKTVWYQKIYDKYYKKYKIITAKLFIIDIYFLVDSLYYYNWIFTNFGVNGLLDRINQTSIDA